MSDQKQPEGVGGARPKTEDGRDIVYVGVPGIESTKAWAKNEAALRKQHALDREVNARIHALNHARELVSYHRATAEETAPATLEQRAEQVVTFAKTLEAYLLGGE